MQTIHCHFCGGFIDNPAGTRSREPNGAAPPAPPHSALCICDHAVVDRPRPARDLGALVRNIYNIR